MRLLNKKNDLAAELMETAIENKIISSDNKFLRLCLKENLSQNKIPLKFGKVMSCVIRYIYTLHIRNKGGKND